MSARTDLFDAHQQAGGKMVDFAGWQLPVHYGSLLEEHHAVRQHAGVFDVSHMGIVDCFGTGASDFLRRLLAGDVATLSEPGKALYTCMLNEDGGILDDLIVYRFGDSDYRLIINAATRNDDMSWMSARATDFQVDLRERNDLALLAVQGPAARSLAQQALGCAEAGTLKRFQALRQGERMWARTGYTGEDGYEIALPRDAVVEAWQTLRAAGARPCGLGARDTLRLEAGLSLYGQDMDTTTTPLECGLAWTVSFADDSRAFIGRQALEQQQADGLQRQQVGLLLQGRGIMRHDYPVIVDAAEVGLVTSGGQSPSIGRSIGMARVGMDVPQRVAVRIRGRDVPARVVSLPFVRNGRVRLDPAVLEETSE